MPTGRCPVCHNDGVPIGMSNITPGIFFWQCTQCENRWHHHSEGTWEHEQADPYIKRGRERWAKGRDMEL